MLSIRKAIKVMRVVAVFCVGALVTYAVVAGLAFFIPMAYFQSQSEYDVGNAGVFVFPFALLAGLVAAPFGGVGAVVFVERLVRR